MRNLSRCWWMLVSALPALSQPYTITTVAGGAPAPSPIAATKASVGAPAGIAVDAAGNVYFTSLNSVFKVDAGGTLTRVAGNSRPGFSGDGGPATAAELSAPGGLALDSNGNVYVNDAGNLRVRRISAGGT